jgi:hypothetical protein
MDARLNRSSGDLVTRRLRAEVTSRSGESVDNIDARSVYATIRARLSDHAQIRPKHPPHYFEFVMSLQVQFGKLRFVRVQLPSGCERASSS